MPARRLGRPVSAALALALAPAVVLPGIASPAAATSPPAVTASATRPALELIGQELFATGTTFRGTEVGGLSGLAWDADRREYVALSTTGATSTRRGSTHFRSTSPTVA